MAASTQTLRVGDADVTVEFWRLDSSEGPAREDGAAYDVVIGVVRIGRIWQETVYRQPSYIRRGVKRIDRTAGATTKIARKVWVNDHDRIGSYDTRRDAAVNLVRCWRQEMSCDACGHALHSGSECSASVVTPVEGTEMTLTATCHCEVA